MARNGAGIYTPPATSFPAVTGTIIDSTKFNNTINDIATALTGSMAVDGQSVITANIPMNSKKFTGMAAGAGPGESVIYEQIPAGMVSITATVASNALTVGMPPFNLSFRSATLGSGAATQIISANSLSIIAPTLATFGFDNASLSRLIVMVVNDSGTPRLALANAAININLDETGIINTTLISATATDKNTIYSTATLTGVPFRVAGFIECTEATAGTWATAPSLIQPAGGQALTGMNSIGNTWQDVSGSRALGTIYTNRVGKIKQVAVTISGAGVPMDLTIDGVLIARANATTSTNAVFMFEVKPWRTYIISGAGTVTYWKEDF